jgi:hypothetical protein
MRFASAVVLASVLLLPHPSNAQMSLDGFGAYSMNRVPALGGESTVPLDFGGRVSFEMIRGVEAIGEFGKIGNVMPATISIPLQFAPIGVRVSAFYGEGGLRLVAAPGSAVSPYVEGTAGVAHMRLSINGLGPTADAIARAALNFVDTRDPMFGGGGGLLLKGGPIHVDLGYRYKRIMANSALTSVLSLGQDMQTHQIRVGMGVRF